MKEYREARRAYDEAAKLFFGHDSHESGRRRLERFQKMGSRIQMMEKENQTLKEELRRSGAETAPTGATIQGSWTAFTCAPGSRSAGT